MKNMEKVLAKLSVIQELIANKVEIFCQQEDISVQDLAICTKIFKEVFGIVLKYAGKSKEIRDEITYFNNIGNENNSPLVQNVYDIAILEDILQDARERFKNDLYLIEHHQNSIDIIKRAHSYVDQILIKDDTDPQHGT